MITVVTTEDRPLDLFGTRAADDLEARLTAQGIELRTLSRARAHSGATLALEGGGQVAADCAISLPQLSDRRSPGSHMMIWGTSRPTSTLAYRGFPTSMPRVTAPRSR